jgi:hypothetical protein
MENVRVTYKDISYIKNDTEFNKNLTNILEKFKENQPYCDEAKGGDSITTCSNDSIFFEIDYKNYIMDWVYDLLKNYFKDTGAVPKQIFFKRLWCNRTFKSCEVKPHKHYDKNDEEENVCNIVIILYYQCEKNSSVMTFIDSDEILESGSDYEKCITSDIELEDGIGIIHGHNLLHSVSSNNSNVPRTCFIFNLKLVY